jgi:hypothetical protein
MEPSSHLVLRQPQRLLKMLVHRLLLALLLEDLLALPLSFPFLLLGASFPRVSLFTRLSRQSFLLDNVGAFLARSDFHLATIPVAHLVFHARSLHRRSVPALFKGNHAIFALALPVTQQYFCLEDFIINLAMNITMNPKNFKLAYFLLIAGIDLGASNLLFSSAIIQRLMPKSVTRIFEFPRAHLNNMVEWRSKITCQIAINTWP